MKNKQKKLIRDVTFACLSALVSSLNLKSFIASGHLVPGGLSGLAVLLQRCGLEFFNINLSYSLMYLTFNLPCIYLAWRYLGRRFTLISLVDIILTAILTTVLPNITITNDILLICIFGGIINGLANILMLSSDACAGGTDFISLYFAKQKNKSCWYEVLAFNCLLLMTNGFLFSWESALYSIIYQYVNTTVVNMFDDRYRRATLFIITSKPQAINEMIVFSFHHSCTKFEGVGGYTNGPSHLIYTVCGQYELDELSRRILQVDPKAFINVIDSAKLLGNFRQKALY